jgi:hypothetical protein
VLARDYRPVLVEDGRLLLRHAPRADPPAAPEVLVERTIAFDELVDLERVPGRCQLLALDIRFTLPGRLRTTFLNAPRLLLEVTTDTGLQRRFRVVPAMMRTGVILNPLIVDVDDWVRFGSGGELPRVTSFRLVPTSSPWMFEPRIGLRILRADDMEPRWWSTLPSMPLAVPGEPRSPGVQALFPEPDPVWKIESGEPVRTVTTSTRNVTVVHAPARAWIPVSAGHHRLTGEFGLAPLARQPGCDAKISVGIVLADGRSRTTLFERDLDGHRAEDLKDAPIDVGFDSPSPAWIWLSTRDRGRDPDCAWTWWGRLRVD